MKNKYYLICVNNVKFKYLFLCINVVFHLKKLILFKFLVIFK